MPSPSSPDGDHDLARRRSRRNCDGPDAADDKQRDHRSALGCARTTTPSRISWRVHPAPNCELKRARRACAIVYLFQMVVIGGVEEAAPRGGSPYMSSTVRSSE